MVDFKVWRRRKFKQKFTVTFLPPNRCENVRTADRGSRNKSFDTAQRSFKRVLSKHKARMYGNSEQTFVLFSLLIRILVPFSRKVWTSPTSGSFRFLVHLFPWELAANMGPSFTLTPKPTAHTKTWFLPFHLLIPFQRQFIHLLKPGM